MAADPQPADAAEIDAFLAEVRAELIRARARFPGAVVRTLALAEEFGELAKAVLDEPAAAVRREAVQTAAMAARVALDGDSSVAEWRAAKGLDPLAGTAADGEPAWARDDEATLCVLTLIGVEIPMPPPLTKPEHESAILEHRPRPGAPVLTPEVLAGWSDDQVKAAEAYAGAVHLSASDNDDIEVPPIPEHLAPFLPHQARWNPLGYKAPAP